jgi:hypothetical protein
MKTKTVKAFGFGQTIHDQPLTKQGRENWDRIFVKKEKKEEQQPEKK